MAYLKYPHALLKTGDVSNAFRHDRRDFAVVKHGARVPQQIGMKIDFEEQSLFGTRDSHGDGVCATPDCRLHLLLDELGHAQCIHSRLHWLAVDAHDTVAAHQSRTLCRTVGRHGRHKSTR